MKIVNGLIILVIIAWLSLIFFSHYICDNTPPNTSLFAASGTEVLQGVFDDQQNTVYIENGIPGNSLPDEAIADIMAKKKAWSREFPTKKVITMSIVHSAFPSSNQPSVAGLLMHYEQR